MTTLFYISLHVIGLFFTLPLSKKIPVWFLACTGFIWGMVIWITCSMVALFLGLTYSWMNMALLLAPLVIAAVMMNISQKTLFLSRKQWGTILASFGFISILAFAVTQKSYVFATSDSFGYIYHGKILAEAGLVPWTVDHFTKLGLFSSVIQMSSHLLPGEYLSGYQTIMACILIAGLFLSMVDIFISHFSKKISFLFAGGLVLILITKIFLNHAFYIHNNLPAAVFLFIALYSYWRFLKSNIKEWMILATVAITIFGFTRIEGPLYVILLLLLVISSNKLAPKQALILVLPYAIIAISWHLFLYTTVVHPEQLSQKNLLVIILALSGLTLLALVSKKIPVLLAVLPELMLSSLFFGLILAFLIEPEHMITSTTHFWQNLVDMFSWGWSWFAVLALIPFTLLNNKQHPENRMLIYSAIGYILIVLLLALARIPYRLGETDSANRLMLQIQPIILLAIASNADKLKQWFSLKKRSLPIDNEGM